MKIKKAFSLIFVIILITLLVACGQKLNSSEIRKYADPSVENILTAMKTGDYTKYSKDFSDQMKTALPVNTFISQNSIIKNKIGNYASKEFTKVDSQEKYVRAIYTTKFTNEPNNVMVTIVFLKDDSSHKVQGLFLSSPKLATK